MGFFSWHTNDSNRSIPNVHQDVHPTFKVVMSDHKGNHYVEEAYDGYGVFGGKDYHVLLAEMNNASVTPTRHPDMTDAEYQAEYVNINRSIGIELYFNEKPNTLYPSLTEIGKYYNKKPSDCPLQGFFYDEEEEDYNDEEDEFYDDTYEDYDDDAE